MRVDAATYAVREMPQSVNSWLRFQVGRHIQRPSRLAWYGALSGKIEGYKIGDNVSVFKLLGYGSTLKAAKAMAGVI